MKAGRRRFLQVLGGLAAGVAVSPLPWRFLGDATIATQAPPVSPEGGALAVARTLCTLCEGGCAVTVRVLSGRRAVGVAGDPASPVNRGGVCPVGAAGLQYLYAPWRVREPLRRTPEGGFRPVSWEAALGELSARLAAARGNPESVAALTGRGTGATAALFRRFLSALGSPHGYAMPTAAEGERRATRGLFGAGAPLGFALENASYVLSLGADLASGWSAPGRVFAAFGGWRRKGVRLVQAEPWCSATASLADEWVPVRAGGEAALALALCHEAARGGLARAEALASARRAFPDVAPGSLDPGEAARKAGLEPSRVASLARELGAAGPRALLLWGDPFSASPPALDRAMLCLATLTGTLGRMVTPAPEIPGGFADGFNPAPSFPDFAAWLSSVAGGAAPAPGVLLVSGADPVSDLASAAAFAGARKRAGFLAVLSPYLNATTAEADLVLPAPAPFEGFDDAEGVPGAHFAAYGLAVPVVAPRYPVRHPADVLIALSRSLGLSPDALPWPTFEACLRARVSALSASETGAVALEAGLAPWDLSPGASSSRNFTDGADLWQKLASGHTWVSGPPPVPGTPSPPPPEVRPATPEAAPGIRAGFPMTLLPERLPAIPARGLAPAPFLVKALPRGAFPQGARRARVNPQDCATLGLRDGSPARLETPSGAARVLVSASGAVPPGVVVLAPSLGQGAGLVVARAAPARLAALPGGSP